MGAAQAVHVLIKVHHLKAVELVCDLFDLLLLSRLEDLYTLGVPFDVLARRGLVLATSLHCTAGNFAILEVCDLVMRDWTG